MKIMLLTRCGCTRWMEIPDKIPPPIYKVLLLKPIRINEYNESDESNFGPIDVRAFKFMDQSRYGNFAVYLEE